MRLVAKKLLSTRKVGLEKFLRCLSIAATTAEPSYYHNAGKKPLVYRNIGQQLELTVAKHANNEAIVSIHEQKRLTYAELFDHVNLLAAGFYKLGLQRGDRIGIWAPNSISWYLTMLAAARAGLESVGLNPAFQAPEIEYCLKKVHIKAIVAPETYKTQNYYDILSSICPELANAKSGHIKSQNLPHLNTIIFDTNKRLKGALNLDAVLNLSNQQDAAQLADLQYLILPDSPCNVQFTSGTTGLPKAALLSHFNFVNNGLIIGERNELNGERICVQMPLFHVYGLVITIMAALTSGATLVLPAAGFNAEASLRAIVTEKCTVIHGTPTMYVDLLKKQKEFKFPLSTAKRAITGGAPCSPQLFLDIKNTLGLQEVRTVFGLTETTSVAFQSLSGDKEEQILNTVGFIHEHTEAKVVDQQGNMVPFGQPGELYVRGYNIMLGYYDDEKKTKETIGDDRWLRTGDQFILHENGYGSIVGRLKDTIIRGGENIFPKEIEDFLNTHADIIETHVIGVPDERMGEEVCAFVRLREGVLSISQDDIKAYAKGRIAHFKVPRYIYAIEDFPKTTSGKIQKFKLKDLFMSKAEKQ